MNSKITIKCPICNSPALFSKDNLFRPFCSERCKIKDLANWATDVYAIPSSPISDEDLDLIDESK